MPAERRKVKGMSGAMPAKGVNDAKLLKDAFAATRKALGLIVKGSPKARDAVFAARAAIAVAQDAVGDGYCLDEASSTLADAIELRGDGELCGWGGRQRAESLSEAIRRASVRGQWRHAFACLSCSDFDDDGEGTEAVVEFVRNGGGIDDAACVIAEIAERKPSTGTVEAAHLAMQWFDSRETGFWKGCFASAMSRGLRDAT